jgi:hypothetical protein
LWKSIDPFPCPQSGTWQAMPSNTSSGHDT